MTAFPKCSLVKAFQQTVHTLAKKHVENSCSLMSENSTEVIAKVHFVSFYSSQETTMHASSCQRTIEKFGKCSNTQSEKMSNKSCSFFSFLSSENLVIIIRLLLVEK